MFHEKDFITGEEMDNKEREITPNVVRENSSDEWGLNKNRADIYSCRPGQIKIGLPDLCPIIRFQKHSALRFNVKRGVKFLHIDNRTVHSELTG